MSEVEFDPKHRVEGDDSFAAEDGKQTSKRDTKGRDKKGKRTPTQAQAAPERSAEVLEKTRAALQSLSMFEDDEAQVEDTKTSQTHETHGTHENPENSENPVQTDPPTQSLSRSQPNFTESATWVGDTTRDIETANESHGLSLEEAWERDEAPAARVPEDRANDQEPETPIHEALEALNPARAHEEFPSDLYGEGDSFDADFSKVSLGVAQVSFADEDLRNIAEENISAGSHPHGAEGDHPEWAAANSADEEADAEANAVARADAATRANANDNGIEFVEHARMLSIIESLLFATDKPLTASSISNAFEGTQVTAAQVRKALQELQMQYADPVRGVSLEEIQGGYQLRTKLDNAEFLKRTTKARPFRLSGPALEVLSIIAYRQPIIKSEVDQIRGVESGHLVRALMEKNLVQFAGKSEAPGRPALYGTTKKFLDIFSLRNINELPSLSEIDDLIPEGIGNEDDDKETLSDITHGMAETAKGTYSGGEEELNKITEQLNAISTSSEFFEQEKRKQREKRDCERAQDLKDGLAVGEFVEDKDLKWLARWEKEQEELQVVRLEDDTVSDNEVNNFLGFDNTPDESEVRATDDSAVVEDSDEAPPREPEPSP